MIFLPLEGGKRIFLKVNFTKTKLRLRSCCWKRRSVLAKLKRHHFDLTITGITDGLAFKPLAFACTGGDGPSATKTITRLQTNVNEKGT